MIAFTMEPDIVSKLNRELGEPITSERQVVYILVELRKLLELQKTLDDYWTLKLCSDWAVHPVLDRATAQVIVSRFDDYEAKYRRDNVGVSQAEMPELTDFVEHKAFRSELIAACQRYEVSAGAFLDDASWRSFLVHYTEIVRDCPFEAKSETTTYVTRVTAQAVTPEMTAVIMPNKQFGIQWTWFRKDIEVPNLVMSFF
jgi:hypothetical protein